MFIKVRYPNVGIDYSIHARLNPGVLTAFLDDIIAGAYRVEELREQDYRRIRHICDRYADNDVGFVDAAVLAIVERLGEPKAATLDHRHFHTLKPAHVERLRPLPDEGLAGRIHENLGEYAK